MTPPRDPDEVEPTLVPDTPARAPAGLPRNSARPAKPVEDTPQHPGAADQTLDIPTPPSTEATDPSARLAVPSAPVPGTADKSTDTKAGADATLIPGPAGSAAGETSATVTDSAHPGIKTSAAEASATLILPPDHAGAADGSSGPLGSDTVRISISTGPSGGPGSSPAVSGTMVGRFALQDLHASGGLGEVFKARDTELNREVAVKRIKSRYADDASSRRRFLTEAELTAKLDHPGVVPVFGLVNDVRGRPCYAMRFIRGETLKDEIERYYGAQKTENREQKTENRSQKTDDRQQKSEDRGKTEATPADTNVPRSVVFRHLLARFIATCQAIAYAHSRNIIHRDIKPANVMVGTFGETLVVDWGLAKALDDGPDFDRVMKAAAAAGFRHDPEATELPSHMTLAGTAVGTPAYMAPEQATGEINKVGPRADVYALGATLYVILTGKPPFSGKSTAEVLDLVRRGVYEPASTVNPDCPKPLDAIAQKAMALRPQDRYATALELAADVERWLSDEPVSCYRDPFFARLARWARRHPARVAAAVSLLLAGVLAAAGVAWAISEGEKRTREEQKKTAAERDNVREQEKKTAAALRVVTEKGEQIGAQNMKITAQNVRIEVGRKLATQRYEKAVAAYNVLVNDIDKKLADRAGTHDLRKTLLLNATDGLKQLVAEEGPDSADHTLVAAYRQMGDVYQRLGETAKARENFQLAVDRARNVHSEAQKGTDADRRAADHDLGRSLDKLAGILLRAGDTKTALERIDEAIAVLTPLAEDKTNIAAQQDLAAARARRAEILLERGETGKAILDSDAALAVRKRLFEAAPGDLERKRAYAASLGAVTALQLLTGRTKDALESARTRVKILTEVGSALKDRPDVAREMAEAYALFGDVYLERSEVTKAAASYRSGVNALKEVIAVDPKNAGARAELAALYGKLASAQLRTGELLEAVDTAAEGQKFALELQKSDPDSARSQRDLALAREQYGDALLAAGRTDEGIAEYTEARALLRRLSAADPESARAKLDLARGLERFGDGCMAKRDLAGALAAFEESVKLRREAAQKDTGSASARRDLAVGLYKLADAHWSAGKLSAANGWATEATDLFVNLAAADPDSAQLQRDIALAYGKWGHILAAGGHTTGALIVWLSSLDRCEKLAKLDPANAQAREDEATATERLASFYAATGNTDRALVSARVAVDMWTVVGDGEERTKAGRRRLALAMLRCGDMSVEGREFRTASDWYAKAKKEVSAPAGDLLLDQVGKQVAEQQEYMKAVQAALVRPVDVMEAPASVRVPALRTAINIELRADHPTTAGAAATQLVKIATAPADIFAAARAFACCAAANRGTDDAKNDYATDAVVQLKRAITEGFRDAGALSGPEWDAVRKRAKDFAQVRDELEKMKGEK
jgi:serine/threonine protein kinase